MPRKPREYKNPACPLLPQTQTPTLSASTVMPAPQTMYAGFESKSNFTHV